MNGSAHGTKYMVGNLRFSRSFGEDSGVYLT
ncbi:unknown [Bacteroides sp. CAG:545]|nr:unknown [Bacteroides sp. CAG:545]